MNDKLKETIQNFLVDYDNTVNDFMSTADYDLWLDTAINLLQQCVVDKTKTKTEYPRTKDKNKEKYEIESGLYVSITNFNKQKYDDIFILSFYDTDDDDGYANYITRDKLKNLALFILDYLERN